MKIGCPMCSGLGLVMLFSAFFLITITNNSIIKLVGFLILILAYVVPANVGRRVCGDGETCVRQTSSGENKWQNHIRCDKRKIQLRNKKPIKFWLKVQRCQLYQI